MSLLHPEDGDNVTMEQIQKRSKWENDDYVCHGIILNGISGSLFDIYQNVESGKELWDRLNIWLRMHQRCELEDAIEMRDKILGT
ncbi:hypothetical protein Tco_1011846 [Tanacetum coccineum]